MRKVFVSSTMRDLKDHRELVKMVIIRLRMYPIDMGDFGSQPGGAVTLSIKEVQNADIFVGIIGCRYGYVSQGMTQSVMEQEYHEAVRLGIPRLMYIAHPDYKWPPDVMENDPTALEKRAGFIRHIEAHEVRTHFTTPENLAAQVASDLGKAAFELAKVRKKSFKDVVASFFSPHKPEPEPESIQLVSQLVSADITAPKPLTKPSVFISYRRKPSAMLATLIAKELTASGIDVFVDTRNLDVAGPFPTRLFTAIEQQDIFVCLLGEGTLESDWVIREINHAYECSKPMLPVFQESYNLVSEPTSEGVAALQQSDGVKVFDISNQYIDEAIRNLARIIKATSQRVKQ